MIRRLLSFLGSLRVTIALIIALAVIFLLGLWVPQKGILTQDLYIQWKARSPGLVSFLEAGRFMEIHTSPLTLTLWTLFFSNLTLVLWRRVAVVRKLTRVDERRLDETSGYPHRISINLTAIPSQETLAGILAREHYRYHGHPARFYAVRNRLSPYASLLFHLSFFLILLGGLVGLYTKFQGTVDLSEGESFHGESERYHELGRLPEIGNLPRFNLVVERIDSDMVPGSAAGIRVTIRDDRGRQTVEVNHPYNVGTTTMVIRDLGVTPLVVIRDRDGKEVDGAFVRLNVLFGKEDSFRLGGLDFRVRFFPDFVVKDGVESSFSDEIRNPVFILGLVKDGKVVEKRKLAVGSRAYIGDFELSIPEMRPYVRFLVVQEQGIGIVYAGFFVATLALAWRLLLYRREIRGTIETGPDGTRMHLYGRAEFYRALFEDEFEELAKKLRLGLV